MVAICYGLDCCEKKKKDQKCADRLFSILNYWLYSGWHKHFFISSNYV